MGYVVAKFGGTSLADANQIKKVKQIINGDLSRKFVVPSAPGKRYDDDIKVTDLLYECYESVNEGDIEAFNNHFYAISHRFMQIVSELNIEMDMSSLLTKVKEDLLNGETKEYAASRGEFLNGQIIATYLGFQFIDPVELIVIDNQGRYNETKTMEKMKNKLLDNENAVIPGFYGSDEAGNVRTFSRGGSDVTGAIVAQAINADLYENWTDVSGFLMADPRIVSNPKTIETITYRELRELSYMGAAVLHEEAIFPVRKSGIPINIKNTNKPQDEGTLIVSDDKKFVHTGKITGIAGHKNFTVIGIEKALMNTEIGFGRKLLSVLENNNVSFEHMPSGIDSISIVISDSELQNGKLELLLDGIDEFCRPDSINVYPNMALIATVGKGMAYTPGVSAKLFAALAGAGVNIRMIDQGSSEMNIIVGVENEDFQKAIKAIYSIFSN